MMLIIFLYCFWEELGEKWRSNGAGNGVINCGASAMIRQCIRTPGSWERVEELEMKDS